MSWRFDCNLPHAVVWRGEDEPSRQILAAMAEFAQLAWVDDVTPPTVRVKTISRHAMLERSRQSDVDACYTVLYRKGADQVTELEVEDTDFADAAIHRGGRWRQIFYLGLLAVFGERSLPVHGALARRDLPGVLFLGQSGMGKSTTMRRLNSPWRVLADDAVLLIWHDGAIHACGLPTWSCSYTGAMRQFQVGAVAPVKAIVELRRGAPTLEIRQGAACYANLLQAFADLGDLFTCGLELGDVRRLRIAAFEWSQRLLAQVPYYRLKLNLMDDFNSLLENL